MGGGALRRGALLPGQAAWTRGGMDSDIVGAADFMWGEIERQGGIFSSLVSLASGRNPFVTYLSIEAHVVAACILEGGQQQALNIITMSTVVSLDCSCPGIL